MKPESLSTLDIYSLALYQKNGDDLKKIAGTGVGKEERQLTVKDAEPGTYYVMVSSRFGTGGYSLTFGNPTPMKGSCVKVDITGRNKVRLGVPCRYTLTMTNTSGDRTNSFFVVIPATSDIKFLSVELPTKSGIKKMSMEEITEEDGQEIVFYVPGLSPYENYSFDFIVEGTSVNSASMMVASVLGGIILDKATDYICDKANDIFELPPAEAEVYMKSMNLTKEQYYGKKQEDGIAVYSMKSVLNQAGENFLEMVPGGKPLVAVGKIAQISKSVATGLRHRLFHWLYKEIGLYDNMDVLDGKVAADGVVASWDPNEKVGPKGYGDENFLAKPQRMTYTIFFENKKEATVPAYRIRIEDTLADVFDLETVQFGATSHSGDGYYWKMDREGNKLTWDIEGIELPPNVNAPEGEGFVSFSVDLKPGIKNGDAIENKATVIFDKNKPIETNVWRNVIDTEAPVTKMLPVNYAAGAEYATVTCQSDDNANGSGIDRYLFYVSKNGEPFTYYAESNEPKIEYAVDKSKTDSYSFYALAVDNVGNTEQTVPAAVSVNTQTGIGDIMVERIAVSPNPSDGIFRATLPTGVTALTVYATSGQIVWKAEAGSIAGTVEINLTAQPAGVYLLKAIVEGKTKTAKLVKQ